MNKSCRKHFDKKHSILTIFEGERPCEKVCSKIDIGV